MKKKNICICYEVNNTLGTGDSNLIEMSVERQDLKSTGSVCPCPHLCIFYSCCLSPIWVMTSSCSHSRGQGVSHASGNAINAALIWPITPTMEADPELLLQLITQPSLHATSCPPSSFSSPLLSAPTPPFQLTKGSWKPVLLPLPTRVEDSRPPFRMTASINLMEVITHHPLGAMSRLPAPSSNSA